MGCQDQENRDEDLISSQPEFAYLPQTARRRGFNYVYGPHLREIIASTTERRNNPSNREKLFKVLNLASNVGGFITGVGGIKGSADAVMNQFSSVFVPSLRRTLPNTSEIHRQNISAFAMDQLEQLASGGQLSRKLFIPRTEIPGIIPGHVVRITAVDTEDLYVSVAQISNTQAGRPTPE